MKKRLVAMLIVVLLSLTLVGAGFAKAKNATPVGEQKPRRILGLRAKASTRK